MAFWLAHFHGLLFLGFIFFTFFDFFLFFLSFDYSFRTYPLSIFWFFNMENICREQRYVHITRLNLSHSKLWLLLVKEPNTFREACKTYDIGFLIYFPFSISNSLGEHESTKKKTEYMHGASQCGHRFMVGLKFPLQVACIFHHEFIGRRLQPSTEKTTQYWPSATVSQVSQISAT